MHAIKFLNLIIDLCKMKLNKEEKNNLVVNFIT